MVYTDFKPLFYLRYHEQLPTSMRLFCKIYFLFSFFFSKTHIHRQTQIRVSFIDSIEGEVNPPSQAPETTAINGWTCLPRICFSKHPQTYVVLFLKNQHAMVKQAFFTPRQHPGPFRVRPYKARWLFVTAARMTTVWVCHGLLSRSLLGG